MPNVTYIKFNNLQNTWNSFTNTSDIIPIATIRFNDNSYNNSDNINLHHNLTSDVILLLEEHKNGSRLFNGSSFAIAVVVCAFLTIIIGCCCACNWYNQYPNSAATNIKKRQRQRHQLLIESGSGTATTTRNRNRNNRNSAIATAILTGTTIRNNENNQRFSRNNNNEENIADYNQNVSSRNGSFNTTFREYFRNNESDRRRLRNSCNRNDRSVHIDREGRQDHHGDQSPEILRRYDLDLESLPSYTLVSGLPTYDDALEQIRKPGIIITTPNIMKIFENYKPPADSNEACNTENNHTSKINSESNTQLPDNTNNQHSINNENSLPSLSTSSPSSATSSSSSSPTLSHHNTVPTIMITPNIVESSSTNATINGNNVTQIIELGPDQLNLLSKKRLSVQIAFNARPISRSQNNLTHLKNSLNGKLNYLTNNDLALLHGRTPSLSIRHLTDRRLSDSLRNSLYIKNSKRNIQHRGSLG